MPQESPEIPSTLTERPFRNVGGPCSEDVKEEVPRWVDAPEEVSPDTRQAIDQCLTTSIRLMFNNKAPLSEKEQQGFGCRRVFQRMDLVHVKASSPHSRCTGRGLPFQRLRWQ